MDDFLKHATLRHQTFSHRSLLSTLIAIASGNTIADIRDPILDETLTCDNNTRDADESDIDCGGSCSGCNDFGQLNLGGTAWLGDGPGEMCNDLPAVDLGAGKTAIAIAAGARHTCALLSDGRVKCWGGNDYGQLGLGDNVWRAR